jgi:hypothetical protein
MKAQRATSIPLCLSYRLAKVKTKVKTGTLKVAILGVRQVKQTKTVYSAKPIDISMFFM